MGAVSLSELGAIVGCLAAIGAKDEIGELIEAKLPRLCLEDVAKHFAEWRRVDRFVHRPILSPFT